MIIVIGDERFQIDIGTLKISEAEQIVDSTGLSVLEWWEDTPWEAKELMTVAGADFKRKLFHFRVLLWLVKTRAGQSLGHARDAAKTLDVDVAKWAIEWEEHEREAMMAAGIIDENGEPTAVVGDGRAQATPPGPAAVKRSARPSTRARRS